MDQWEWYCKDCQTSLVGAQDIFYDARDNVHCVYCNRIVQRVGKPKDEQDQSTT